MTYPYEKQIIRALHDVDEGLAAPPPDNSFQRYARHADDYRVTINRFRRIPYVACTAIVQATDESLAQLFATYSNVAHQPLSPAFINYFVRHEAQHASCAQKLGATAVWYALSFCRAEADIFGQVYDIDGAATIAQNFQTTKLGLAILSAYPEQPSEDDLQDVYNLGYKSIDDVANRAIVYNAQGYSYPIPLGRTSNKGL